MLLSRRDDGIHHEAPLPARKGRKTPREKMSHKASKLTVHKLELSSKVITEMLICVIVRSLEENAHNQMPSWEDKVSVFFSVTKPDIETGMYVRRLVKYAHCSRSAFIVALVYLDRLRDSYPMLALTEFNMHRLYITALMIAAKTLDDRCYSNAHYARVGGIATVSEINRLELAMLCMLEFCTYVFTEEYVTFVEQLSHLVIPKIPLPIARRISAKYKKRVNERFVRKLGLRKLQPMDGGVASSGSMVETTTECPATSGQHCAVARAIDEHFSKMNSCHPWQIVPFDGLRTERYSFAQ